MAFNCVELMAGVEVEQPIRCETRLPACSRRVALVRLDSSR